MEIIKNPNFDFIGKARYFVALSVLLIVASVAWIATGHVRYGVEFSGGTIVIVKFDTAPSASSWRAKLRARSKARREGR